MTNSINNIDTAVVLGHFKDDKFLFKCIEALKKQTYKNFDIWIYDNSNQKDALKELKLKFPFINIIKNHKNLGFAGGNNSVVRKLLKEENYNYIALLNDDTNPKEDWLESLIITISKDKKLGAVGSKLIYYESFVRLFGSTETINLSKQSLSSDSRDLGVMYFEDTGFENSVYNKRFYRDGFWGIEKINDTLSFSWTKDKFVLDLPIGDKIPEKEYYLKLHIRKNSNIKNQSLKIKIGEFETIIELNENEEQVAKIPIDVIQSEKINIIQNATSKLTTTFHGSDIGNGDIDQGQYDDSKEAEMICGGAVLFRADALKEVGLFDEYYFNYYEDSDLSMRLKKYGWKLKYEPKSVVNHFHTGSGVEWSPFFIYQVTRNKIVFAMKNLGFKAITRGWIELFAQTLFYLMSTIKSRFKNQTAILRLKINLRIIINLILNTPLIYLKRYKIIKTN